VRELAAASEWLRKEFHRRVEVDGTRDGRDGDGATVWATAAATSTTKATSGSKGFRANAFPLLAVKSLPNISRFSPVFLFTFGWVLSAQGASWTPILGLPGPPALPPRVLVIHAGAWWSYLFSLWEEKYDHRPAAGIGKSDRTTQGGGREGRRTRARELPAGVNQKKPAIAAPTPCSKRPIQAHARKSRAPPRPHARNRTGQATRDPVAMSTGHFRPTQSGPTAREATYHWSVASAALKKTANEQVNINILNTAAAKDDWVRALIRAVP